MKRKDYLIVALLLLALLLIPLAGSLELRHRLIPWCGEETSPSGRGGDRGTVDPQVWGRDRPIRGAASAGRG